MNPIDKRDFLFISRIFNCIRTDLKRAHLNCALKEKSELGFLLLDNV